MSESYNKHNIKKNMPLTQVQYKAFSNSSYRAGANITKEVQESGAGIFGGSGKMGEDITATFAVAGCPVDTQDINEAKLKASQQNAYRFVGKGVEKRKVSPKTWTSINRSQYFRHTIVFPNKGSIPFKEINEAASNSEADAEVLVANFLDNALEKDTQVRKDYSNLGMVLEAGPEAIGFKQNVFKFFELALNSKNAIIATNTSSLCVDDIAAKMTHPERAVGFHYFIPANRNPLVEIIAGSKTSLEVIQAMQSLALAMGKKPIICWGDRPGAIANRILVGILNEAAKLADSGIASRDFIDQVFLETFYPEQINIKTNSAKTQFEAAPKLAFFKDEAKNYKLIEQYDIDAKAALEKGDHALRRELLAKKFALLEETFGGLRQKVLYADITINLAKLGTFYTPSESVKQVRVAAQEQLNKLKPYMEELERTPETIVKPFKDLQIHPYDFPESTRDEHPNARRLIKERLLAAYMAIAIQIHKEGLATAHDIDLACKEGFKYNFGPLEEARRLGREKTSLLISKLLETIDTTKETGICSANDYPVFNNHELSGVQSYIQNNVGIIDLGRLHMQQLRLTQNSLGPEMLEGLRHAIRELQAQGAKAIVFKSQGGGPFSSGADLTFIRNNINNNPEKVLAFRNLGKQLMKEIKECPLPTVAVVDGAAVGGGLELALACDYRIFTDLAYAAMPEVGLGIIPDWGGTEELAAIVGKLLAKGMICTARLSNLGIKLGGEDAYKVGLADMVCTQAELPHKLADLLEGKGPININAPKPPRKRNYDVPLEKYPTDIVARFKLKNPTGGRRFITKHAEEFARDLIEHSDDPTYAPRVDNDAAFRRLINSGKWVGNIYIEPIIAGLQNRFFAPILEKFGLG